MPFMNTRLIFVALCLSSLALLPPTMLAQDARSPNPPKVVVQTDGTVEVPAQEVPDLTNTGLRRSGEYS